MREPAIEALGVSKYFGDFPALQDVSLEVGRGQVLALLGRNGAGKTTMLRILAGLTSPTSGTIRFPPGPAAGNDQRARTGVIGHGTWIYDDLTGAENLRFFSRLYGVAQAGRTCTEWLRRVGLERYHGTRAGEYSRGMRQRLAIARAFLHDPEVLLLDEPWTALDDRAVSLLSGLVSEARQAGRAVVVCSHQLREAVGVADSVVLLHRGKVAHRGPIDSALRADPQSLYELIP